ncbi:uncharacterized protein LOC143289146 isoform X2 [Babylonia areolata]|uniref:uncharacterized protein LOC143289146 isoform X2 n=1 Tax=Babylonia areolata TaxID=304850 RepID=UPI003FD295E3
MELKDLPKNETMSSAADDELTSPRGPSDFFIEGPSERSQCKRHRYVTAVFAAVFTVLDLILFILLVVVCVKLAGLEPALPENHPATTEAPRAALLEDSSFCLPCLELYLTEIEVRQNRFQVVQKKGEEGEGMLCCAKPHDDLTTLLGNMFLRIHYAHDRASGNLTLPNDTDEETAEFVNHHLQLELDPVREPEEWNGTHTVPLTLSKREAPTDDGTSASLLFQEDCVTIQQPGHFNVHSLVPFTFRLQPVILTQYVYRVRNGGHTLLLENSVFPCDVEMQSCDASFVGGVFLFESGDRVVLRVSNHSYVDKERELMFGVHKL